MSRAVEGGENRISLIKETRKGVWIITRLYFRLFMNSPIFKVSICIHLSNEAKKKTKIQLYLIFQDFFSLKTWKCSTFCPQVSRRLYRWNFFYIKNRSNLRSKSLKSQSPFDKKENRNSGNKGKEARKKNKKNKSKNKKGEQQDQKRKT